jgi:hypothetical protein
MKGGFMEKFKAECVRKEREETSQYLYSKSFFWSEFLGGFTLPLEATPGREYLITVNIKEIK